MTSPIQTFDSKNYERVVKAIKDHFKEEAIETKGLYGSFPTWKKRFKTIIDRCDKLVYFVCENGTIGRGVYFEICHVSSKNMKVYLYDGRKGIISHHHSFIHIIHDGTNYTEYAEVSIDGKRTSVTPLLKRGKSYELVSLDNTNDAIEESGDAAYGSEEGDEYYWNEVMGRD